MNKKRHRIGLLAATAAILLGTGGVALANHSWDNYHWARTSNPFTLKVVDSVTSTWDPYLVEAKNDWSASSVLDLTIEPEPAGWTKAMKDRRRCWAVSGKIRACNYAYGNNGWLGIASIWASGNHITQATTQVNDTYFNTSTYNTPAWRRLVMCQEIAHDFGLDHQDENFSNPNLGSCMDYTNDPDGPPSNEHPNQHDYDQLEAIYAHFDSFSTVKNAVVGSSGQNKGEDENSTEFGKALKQDNKGRNFLFEKDYGNGKKKITFVFWAE